MEALSTSQIEIQVPELGPEELIKGRRDYRVDTGGRSDFFMRMRGASYPVLDAGASGVRILIETDTVLAVDELVPDCELRLGRDIFAGLRGRVVHCTLLDDGHWVSGVEWIDMNVQVTVAMTELLARLRREFFDNE